LSAASAQLLPHCSSTSRCSSQPAGGHGDATISPRRRLRFSQGTAISPSIPYHVFYFPAISIGTLLLLVSVLLILESNPCSLQALLLHPAKGARTRRKAGGARRRSRRSPRTGVRSTRGGTPSGGTPPSTMSPPWSAPACSAFPSPCPSSAGPCHDYLSTVFHGNQVQPSVNDRLPHEFK
jgi:hypothetical protein